MSLFGGLFFQVAHLNGSLLHLSGQLPYTLLQVEDGGGHLVLFLLVGSGVFRTHIFQFLLKVVLALAVATSIDALAVGVSFAFLGIKQFSAILSPIGIIGFVSFALSMVGLMFGIRFGCGIARRLRAELWGGIILVIIGTKILVEHLFF